MPNTEIQIIPTMNNGNSESLQATSQNRSARNRDADAGDELSRVKRDLMKAEVRLARARATVVTAEIDVKSLTTRLRSLAK